MHPQGVARLTTERPQTIDDLVRPAREPAFAPGDTEGKEGLR